MSATSRGLNLPCATSEIVGMAAALKIVRCGIHPFGVRVTNIHGAENVGKRAARGVRKVVAFVHRQGGQFRSILRGSKLACRQDHGGGEQPVPQQWSPFLGRALGNVLARVLGGSILRGWRAGAKSLPITDSAHDEVLDHRGAGGSLVLSSVAMMQGAISCENSIHALSSTGADD